MLITYLFIMRENRGVCAMKRASPSGVTDDLRKEKQPQTWMVRIRIRILIYSIWLHGVARCDVASTPRVCRGQSRSMYWTKRAYLIGLYIWSIYRGMRGSKGPQSWRIMIPGRETPSCRALMNSDVRCYECSVRRDIRTRVCRSTGQR